MDKLVFTVPENYKECALHAEDDNGFVFYLRSQVENKIGPFTLQNGFATKPNGEKYVVSIEGLTVILTRPSSVEEADEGGPEEDGEEGRFDIEEADGKDEAARRVRNKSVKK
jgi:hypothetical protein